MENAAQKVVENITVPKIQIKRVTLSIKGTSPLIVHAWSEKAKKQMRDKQQGAAKTGKEKKDPVADFKGAKYLNAKGKDCVPAIAFKSAIVSAARYADDMKMTVLRGALFVEGDLIPLTFDDCVMREDMVRVGMGTADMRYRPEYQGWKCQIVISYNSSMLSLPQIVNLVKLAGFSVGICEWRPEKDGQFGRFDVDDQVQA